MSDRRADRPVDVHDPEGVRLQKVLAGAGLGSRRACEELIAAGRVSVDGVVVAEQGVRIDPRSAVVHVDGLRLQLDTSVVTIVLNKPLGVVSTMSDPQGRPSLAQFVADRPERLFHVGRLDAETEGLLLLTNDGELANRLAHPSHGVAKTYLATVQGRVKPAVGVRLRTGVDLDDGPVVVDSYRVVDATASASLVEVVLHEGRNPMTVRAIRGATQLDRDEREHLFARSAELVQAVLDANRITADALISILFTCTPDLRSDFPATAAREMGMGDVPLICAVEMDVPGALPRVVRLMAHADLPVARSQVQHVYLHGATAVSYTHLRAHETR